MNISYIRTSTVSYIRTSTAKEGAQWLNGRVLDSRSRGRGFEPHRRHCVVVLEKYNYPSLVLVQPRKTRPCLTERLLLGRKESNQTKQNSLGKQTIKVKLCELHNSNLNLCVFCKTNV